MLLACHSLTLHCACVCVPFAASSVKYSGMLEADPFPSGGGSHQGTTADYFFMMIFGACIMFLTTLFFPLRLLGECMVFMIIYAWSRRNPDAQMSFFGRRCCANFVDECGPDLCVLPPLGSLILRV